MDDDSAVAPGDARTGDGLDDLGYWLRQAAAAHRLRMDRALGGLGVTPPQFLVLALLAQTPGLSSADLARTAALTTATMSVIVGNLERMKAIVRSAHGSHGRIQILELSDTGRSLLAAGRSRAAEVERELAAGLSPAEAQTLRTWLGRTAREH